MTLFYTRKDPNASLQSQTSPSSLKWKILSSGFEGQLFITLYKVFLTFKSVNEILKLSMAIQMKDRNLTILFIELGRKINVVITLVH